MDTREVVPAPAKGQRRSSDQIRSRRLRAVLLQRPHRGRPAPASVPGRWLRALGPGLITGAADDDPSGIGTYSQTGAAFGPGMLWLALYLIPLTIVVQEMCGRIGLVSGMGLAGVIRRCYGRRLLYVAVGLLFVANTINVGADLGAMAASLHLLVPVPTGLLLVVFAFGILGLEVFVPYRLYASVLKILTLSLLAYVLTGILIQPDWGLLLRDTLVPTVQFTPTFLALTLGVLGTTISPYLFFWQASEEVEEAKLHHRNTTAVPARHTAGLKRQIHALRIDTVTGLVAASVTFWFIVMTTSSTLHVHGITNIDSAQQAAEALRPLVKSFPHAGKIAEAIFALGIVGTGLLAVPVLAGSAAYGIAESFGWREGLSQTLAHARGFYAVIAASTLIGLALDFIGINPIAALVYTAVINGIVAVPLLVLILMVANNKKVLGSFVNGRVSNVIGGFTVLVMGLAAIGTILLLLQH